MNCDLFFVIRCTKNVERSFESERGLSTQL